MVDSVGLSVDGDAFTFDVSASSDFDDSSFHVDKHVASESEELPPSAVSGPDLQVPSSS